MPSSPPFPRRASSSFRTGGILGRVILVDGRRASRGSLDPAPPGLDPPPGHPRFPCLDGLRALAALSVLASHVVLVVLGARVPGILGALGSGVTIFFVISGFLLYWPFAAARLGSGRAPALGTYLRRRAIRIFPAYWLALTALSIFPGGLTGTFGRHSPIFYSLLQYWFPRLRTQGLPQAWSLSVEVAWYLLLGVVTFLAATWARQVPSRGNPFGSWLRREVVLLCLLAALRLAYEPLSGGALDALLAYLDWFLAGMALAVASVAAAARPRTPALVRLVERHGSVCWLAAFGVYCTFAFRLDHRPPTFLNHLEQGLFAALVVTPAVFAGGRRGPVPTLLRNPLVAWLGLISYGIYLWHVPIVLALAQTRWVAHGDSGRLTELGGLTLLISIGCAAISYYLLERPLLDRERRRRPSAVALPRTGGGGRMSRERWEESDSPAS